MCIDWTPLEIANEQQTLQELKGTRYYSVAVNLANQGANPEDMYRHVTFSTHEVRARLLILAAHHLQRGMN